jgi:hypothetical protein
MGRRSTLSDDVVAAILLAPPREHSDALARQLGLSIFQVRHIRQRTSRHALRIAARLGLVRRSRRTCYASDGAVVVRHIDEVAAAALHLPYGR